MDILSYPFQTFKLVSVDLFCERNTIELCYNMLSGSLQFCMLYPKYVISNTVQYDSTSYGSVH